MKILLVEDDNALAANLLRVLAEENFSVDHAATGEQADFLIRTEEYDVVTLDMGLPDGSGSDWLARWREDDITLPVLILTARTLWSDKADGFNAGADDYLTKPFEVAELLFRLRALIRRSHGHAHPQLTVGQLSFNTNTKHVTLAGLTLKLTAQEVRLLEYLLHASPRVVSRTELAEHVYDRDTEPDSNVIDVQISRIRRKLNGGYIETLRGQGYRVVDSSADVTL